MTVFPSLWNPGLTVLPQIPMSRTEKVALVYHGQLRKTALIHQRSCLDTALPSTNPATEDSIKFIPPKVFEAPKMLLDKNADVMLKTAVRSTPLHFFSRYGRHDMIESMVQAHADPNAEDADDTPLICSTYEHPFAVTDNQHDIILCSTYEHPFAVTDNQHDIIQQLHSHCADYTLKAEKERNMVHLAAMHRDKMTMDILSHARQRVFSAAIRRKRARCCEGCLDHAA